MNEDSLEFLPVIPDMPSPPNDPDDLAAWQAHIKTMDRYLLDLNEAIRKIEDGDFIKNFRQSLAQRGVDLDENIILPKSLMEEVGGKVKEIINGFHEFGRHLGIDKDTKPQRRITKSNRNIKSI